MAEAEAMDIIKDLEKPQDLGSLKMLLLEARPYIDCLNNNCENNNNNNCNHHTSTGVMRNLSGGDNHVITTATYKDNNNNIHYTNHHFDNTLNNKMIPSTTVAANPAKSSDDNSAKSNVDGNATSSKASGNVRVRRMGGILKMGDLKLDTEHARPVSLEIDAGRSGGKQTTIITQATTHNTSTNYSTKSSNINTTPTKNINIVVNNTPPTTHTPNASPSSLIKGFFMRKRHKSVGSASIPSPVCKRHDVIMTSLNGGITSGSGGASTKIKNFFFGASRHRRKTSESVVSVSIVPEMNKSRGSLSTTPPHTANPLLPTSEPPLGGLGVLTEGVSSPPRVLFLGSIYNTKPLSDLPHNPKRRSVSTVTPVDFVQMYRMRSTEVTSHPSNSALPSSVRSRKVSLGCLAPLSCNFEARQVIIWKDQDLGTQVFRLPTNDDKEKMIKQLYEDEDEEEEDEAECGGGVYLKFMRTHPAYDAMPTSTKLVILDSSMPLHKAIQAIITNNIHATAIWNSRKQNFMGLLTLTDYIKVLLMCHKENKVALPNSPQHTLDYWAGKLYHTQGEAPKTASLSLFSRSPKLSSSSSPPVTKPSINRLSSLSSSPSSSLSLTPPKTSLQKSSPHKPLHNFFITLSPDCTMLEATQEFIKHHVHRLPILDDDTGDILYCMTIKRILRYLHFFFNHYKLSKPSYFNLPINQLSIGTYQNIKMITMETTLESALDMLLSNNLSCLPIINEQFFLVGVFNKALVLSMEPHEVYVKMNLPIEKIFSTNLLQRDALTCNKLELLCSILDRILNSHAHRLIVVDVKGRVEGIISCSDIIKVITKVNQSEKSYDSSSSISSSFGSLAKIDDEEEKNDEK